MVAVGKERVEGVVNVGGLDAAVAHTSGINRGWGMDGAGQGLEADVAVGCLEPGRLRVVVGDGDARSREKLDGLCEIAHIDTDMMDANNHNAPRGIQKRRDKEHPLSRRWCYRVGLESFVVEAHRHRGGAIGATAQQDVAPFARGVVDGVHDVEDMVGQFARSAVGAIFFDCDGHVEHTETAAVFGKAVAEGHLAPGIVAGAADLDSTAKVVGVGDEHGAFAAVDFEPRQGAVPDIKAGDDAGDGPLGEVEYTDDMSGGVDGDFFAVLNVVGDSAFGKRNLSRAADAGDCPKQGGQGGQVIRTHVKHGARTRLIKEVGIGVPGFGTTPHHKGGGADGATNPAVIDEFAAGLQARTKEGVRGTADAHTFGFGVAEHFLGVGTIDSEGLFVVDRFASGDGGEGHFAMSSRDGEIDDKRNRRIGQQFCDATSFGDAEFGGSGLGTFDVDVGDCGDCDAAEALMQVFEVDATNVAASDDTNGGGGHDSSFAVSAIQLPQVACRSVL